jgi:hypothetical protein
VERHVVNGVEFWSPTPEEVREAVTSSLSHAGLGLHYGMGTTLAEQNNRVETLNRLYEQDKRHLSYHPHHLLNTGLVQKMEEGVLGDLHWGQPDAFAPVEG